MRTLIWSFALSRTDEPIILAASRTLFPVSISAYTLYPGRTCSSRAPRSMRPCATVSSRINNSNLRTIPPRPICRWSALGYDNGSVQKGQEMDPILQSTVVQGADSIFQSSIAEEVSALLHSQQQQLGVMSPFLFWETPLAAGAAAAAAQQRRQQQ